MPPPPVTPKRSTGSSKSTVQPQQKKANQAEIDEFEEWKKSKQLLRPKNQLDLSDPELKEIMPRILQTINVQHPDDLVMFHFASGTFVPIPMIGHMVTVLYQKGNYIHKDSEEARKQMIAMGYTPTDFLALQQSQHSMDTEILEESVADQVLEDVDEEEEEEGQEGEGQAQEGGGKDDEETEAQPKHHKKKLTNQFNFCERASSTYNNPNREQSVQTTPTPLQTFSAFVLQWIIYDGYMQDYAEQELEKEKERERREKDKMPISKVPTTQKRAGRAQLSHAVQGRVYQCWRTLERMINQNTYNYLAQDYRYWEDPADEYRDEEGTLLPLWKFSYDRMKKYTVTDFCWNPYYYDLFAVTFGSLDFKKQMNGGCFCLFTLKNPSFPDYICLTESSAMSIDIHQKYPYMIVVGLYDGSVLVYNIQQTCKEPAYKSNPVTQKHSGIVWTVQWAPDMPDGELNFYSASADGKINHWILMQSELAVNTIITLYLDQAPLRNPDGTFVKRKACATCMMFHPVNKKVYLIGTEEGLIYTCSTNYSSTYIYTCRAHDLAIYRIDFNRVKPVIFASCSADWKIKIWEENQAQPLYVFDLKAPVGDVQWAPYSTTVLGAVTSKGKAYIFDLNVNLHKPMCEQGIVSKKKFSLARFSFNYRMPIIICGDDKGCTTTLKLSPNLRIMCKPPKKAQDLSQQTLQEMKLDKLLSTAREPPILKPPPDRVGLEA